MSPTSSFSRLLPILAMLLGAVVTFGCAAGLERTRMPDGSYALKCEDSLSICLQQIEPVCQAHGYDIIAATEKRARYGPDDVANETVHSEARVRCRRPKPLFELSPEKHEAPAPAAVPVQPIPAHVPLPPLSAAPPAPATPPPACVPGVSQACAGPGGCQGAQICADDGRRFGACDCGPPPVPSGTPAESPAP